VSVVAGERIGRSPTQGAPAEYKAGLDLAIAKGWLWLHESGTYVRLTEAGAALLA
jgi:hypothetical protein